VEGWKYLIIAGVLAASSASAESHSNKIMKLCLEANNYSVENFDTFDFTKAARCHSDYRVGQHQVQLAEMRDFLDANPRYRVPGQSQNRCWGRPREMAFESATLSAGPGWFSAGISYKDTLPAGCYENAPWDNREGHPDDK